MARSLRCPIVLLPNMNILYDKEKGLQSEPSTCGGAIGFALAMVIFSKFQLGRSLMDITVRTKPSAFNLKLNLAYFITSVKKKHVFFTCSKIEQLTMAARRQGSVRQQHRLAKSPNSTPKITNVVRFYFRKLLSYSISRIITAML